MQRHDGCNMIEAVSYAFMRPMKPTVRLIIAMILFVVIILVGKRVFAAAVPEVGDHTPLIKIEKNENPQNLMIVYTKLNSRCGFISGPVLDEYWLMDGSRYKKVNPLIKQGIRKRFQLDESAFARDGRFIVRLKDFHELKSDLGPEPSFEVHTNKAAAGCQAVVEMKLGPSDKNRTIAIESIYADSSKKLLPPFRKLNSLTLTGKDVVTGESVKRTYSSN